jgi:1-acyl-sn-glycerol-3-phosphate acyltransferase
VIPAKKSPLFDAWFARHVRGRFARSFETVRVRGLEALRAATRETPMLVVSNHTSWWDPLATLLVSHAIGTDGYALMDAKNLRRLPFFARVGGFGVDLTDATDGAAAIRYAAKLLDRPGRLVWIFPQGTERPITARPLGFMGGSAAIARVARRARVVPIALRYELGATERPTLHVAIGDALPVERDVAAARAQHEAAVERALADIDEALCKGRGAEAFEILVAGTPDRVGAWAEIALARLT